MKLDAVSVVIVCTEASQAQSSIDAASLLLKMDACSSGHELIIAEGNSPSEQRNLAANQAKGSWLLFLDNDSVVDGMILEYYRLGLTEFPDAKVLGGSSLLRPETDSSVELAIQGVFSSDLGVGPLKSRYFPTGKTRPTSEKELILCNMLVERSLFLSAGGFKPGLYPNEENEFLNRVSKSARAIYCPGAVVYRNHRKTVSALATQMFRYGQGRLRHFRVAPSLNQLVFFLPLAFVIYFLTLLMNHSFWLPGLVYLLLISFEGSIRAVYHRKWQIFPLSVVCYFICHFFYAMGLALGLVLPKRKRVAELRLKDIKITSNCPL